MRFDHPEPFTPKWQGRWIWFERPRIVTETATRPVASASGSVGLFRRTVDLAAVPATAPCRVWVDGRYLLRWMSD